MATAALASVTDAGIVEADRPYVRKLDIQLDRLPQAFDGFTIAQLSDFHYDELFSATAIRNAVQIVNGLGPDLVVLTGDFVTGPLLSKRSHEASRKAAQAAGPCAALLRDLTALVGKVAVLGNHDLVADAGVVTDALQSQGIPVLRNLCVPFERAGARIWVSGTDSCPPGRHLDITLKGVPRDEASILLVHEPDIADAVCKYPVDLQLSGHSHGGQIRLPVIGPLYLPKFGRKYAWGLQKVGQLTLYTNAGIGTVRVPMRLNCPPEVTLFTLRRAGTS
ncbi:MAG TPA: metallophosphoesterase [Terriglobales bacterium]|nr:metallophosphoesterase [Terriglobales bacterium]